MIETVLWLTLGSRFDARMVALRVEYFWSGDKIPDARELDSFHYSYVIRGEMRGLFVFLIGAAAALAHANFGDVLYDRSNVRTGIGNGAYGADTGSVAANASYPGYPFARPTAGRRTTKVEGCEVIRLRIAAARQLVESSAKPVLARRG